MYRRSPYPLEAGPVPTPTEVDGELVRYEILDETTGSNDNDIHVYLIARTNPIFAHAPSALVIVAGIGIFTAILAASIAMTQTDIKRVLAYSTLSQPGYMFAALGVGAFTAALFHLMTHGFFQGLLFLGSGSVVHGCNS